MASGWNGIISGTDTGDVVEANLTSAFTNLDADIASVESMTDNISATQPIDLDLITVTQAVDLDAIETSSADSKVKTDFITVTQAVDLDAMEVTIATNTQDIVDTVTGDTPQDKTTYVDVTGSEPSYVEGQVFYANGGFNVHSEFDGVTLQVGKEQFIKVANTTGVDIPNGSAVTFEGLAGGLPSVKLALANNFDDAIVLGISTMVIPTGGDGLVTTFGSVSDLDTNALTPGARFYLSNTVPGGFTETAPEIATLIGTTLVSDLTAGQIFVKARSVISLPNITAYMADGAIATIDLAQNVFQTISGYTSSGNVILPYDAGAGTITMPNTGTYKLSVNLIALFDAVGNQEEGLTLRLTSSVSPDSDIPLTIPRNSGSTSAYPKITFDAVAGETLGLSVAALDSTLANFTLPLMGFEVESVTIR